MKFSPWAETVLRAAVEQTNIDPLYPETSTSGYQVVDLRGGFSLPGGVGVEVGIENLFDQDYTDHLAREVPLDVGGLQAGDKIPMPGRFFYAGVKWSM